MIPNRLKHYFAAPVFPGDDEKTQLAGILWAILLSLVGIGVAVLPFCLNSLWRPGIIIIAFAACLSLLHRGYVHAVRELLLVLLATLFSVFAWTTGGVQSLGFYGYVVMVVCAALLYRLSVLVFITGLGILNGLAMVLAAHYHVLPASRVVFSPELLCLGLSGVFLSLALVTRLAQRHLQSTRRYAQHEFAERRRAEQALRDSEERYRQLVELSPCGIFVHQHGALVYVNQAGIDLMGGSRAEELLGKPVIEYVHPESRDMVRQRIQRAVEQGQPSPFVEEQFLRLDGDAIDVRAAAIPIRYRDVPAVQVVALDISAQKRAENEIRSLNAELESRVNLRTAELESANRELKDFAYVVSHDLKAPLRAISRLANWLRDDYATAFDKKGNDMVDLLVGRVKRMDNLIDGILEYSRIGRIESVYTTVDLNILIAEVLDSLAPPEHVHVVVVSPLPTLTLSKVRIFQVFQNLIGNAIKFSDQPSVKITIDCTAEGQLWKFSVSDNGPGIDAKYHERIFQVFQSLKPRDEVESTGIGLALVKKIIELYSGEIGVDSTLGTGCCFWFTLPQQSGM